MIDVLCDMWILENLAKSSNVWDSEFNAKSLFSIFNGAFTGISQHPLNSFPGPLPWLGSWTEKPSQGKGPENEVEQAPGSNYCSFIIRNNINLASSSFQHFSYCYAFDGSILLLFMTWYCDICTTKSPRRWWTNKGSLHDIISYHSNSITS